MSRPKREGPALEGLALKVDADLALRLRHFAHVHRRSLSDLLREGALWRLTQPPTLGPGEPEHAAQLPLVDHGPLPPQMRDQIAAMIRAALATGQLPATGAPVPVDETLPRYDPARFRLGTLCSQGHEWGTTGQSLRLIKNGTCTGCQSEATTRSRQRPKQCRAGHPPYPASRKECPVCVAARQARQRQKRKASARATGDPPS